MNRRQVLQYTAWFTGASVSAPLAGAILSGCSREAQNPPPGSGELPVLHFFAPEPFQRLRAVTDAILPRTDSPSASDVGVDATIDRMIGQVFDDGYRDTFRAGWEQLEVYLEQQEFLSAESAEQANVLRALELGDDQRFDRARAVYLDLKQQTIAYYLTTEEVAENHLNYLPIPGDYEPCISIDDVNNKAWAI